MRQHVLTLLTVFLFIGACDFERDIVAPGYYGAAEQAGRAATPPSMVNNQLAGPPAGGSTPVQPPTGEPNQAMSPAAQAMSPGAQTGSPGAQTMSPGAQTMSPGAQPPASTPAAGACDLSGRWLSTLHQVTDSLGQLQTSHKYIYYEIEQSGDSFRVTKGLLCMSDVIAEGDFAITGDFSGAWPALMNNVVYAGRTGSSTPVASGCKVELVKHYTVYGASVPYYLDPALPLPTAADQATATTPGWQDWDGDGNPGITGALSGTVTGKVFVAPREWTSLTGTVPSVSGAFGLPLMWNNEPNVMTYDGSPLLASEAVRAADPALHFAEFVRLKPEQAMGSDDAICQSMRELAPMLTPKAAAL